MTHRGYACVGLYNAKNPLNVGSVMRAAGCFGASMIAVSGQRFNYYKRAVTDTGKFCRHIPLVHVENLRDAIPFDCVPVAVDMIDGAVSLENYRHPERAYYIFGPEDGTLGASVTDWCRDVVSIPTAYCLNLAAAVNVVLYDRAAKALAKSEPLRTREMETA